MRENIITETLGRHAEFFTLYKLIFTFAIQRKQKQKEIVNCFKLERKIRSLSALKMYAARIVKASSKHAHTSMYIHKYYINIFISVFISKLVGGSNRV